MNTLNILTEIAQRYRFMPSNAEFDVWPPQDARSSETKYIKFRKERTRRTLGVRTVSDVRSSLGIIEIDVWYKGPDIWLNRSKKITLCDPDSLLRLKKYFKRAK